MNRVKEYILSVYKEISAITWPSSKRVYNDTIVVLVALFVSVAFIGLLDSVFSTAIQKLIEKISS